MSPHPTLTSRDLEYLQSRTPTELARVLSSGVYDIDRLTKRVRAPRKKLRFMVYNFGKAV